MKSIVGELPMLEAIAIPNDYLIIEIPDWNQILELFLTTLLEGQSLTLEDLTDEWAAGLGLEGVDSVYDLRQLGLEIMEERMRRANFDERVLPYIIHRYLELTDIVVNDQDLKWYYEQYQSQFDEEIDAESLSESMVLYLIAVTFCQNKGIVFDELTYDEFIQCNIMEYHVDAIDVQEQWSFTRFCLEMPEVYWMQALYDETAPLMRFKITNKADNQ